MFDSPRTKKSSYKLRELADFEWNRLMQKLNIAFHDINAYSVGSGNISPKVKERPLVMNKFSLLASNGVVCEFREYSSRNIGSLTLVGYRATVKDGRLVKSDITQFLDRKDLFIMTWDESEESIQKRETFSITYKTEVTMHGENSIIAFIVSHILEILDKKKVGL